MYLEGLTHTPSTPPIIYNLTFYNIIVLLLCCIDIYLFPPSYTIPNILFSIVTTIVLYVINECMRDTPAAVSHTLYLSSHTLPGCVLLVYISSLNHTQVFLYYPSYKITNTVLKVMYLMSNLSLLLIQMFVKITLHLSLVTCALSRVDLESSTPTYPYTDIERI